MRRYAEDLHLACDALVQRTKVQVDHDGTLAWHTLPSLLEQLAAGAATFTDAGAGAARSRSPINTGVVALLTEISVTARRQLRDLGAPDHGGDIVRNIRAATTATIASDDQDEFSAWLYVLARWRNGARRELRLDSGRRQWLRGVACPDCGARVASSRDSEGGAVLTPALAVTWSEPADGQAHLDEQWRFQAIECRVCCATWWRGPALSELVTALLAAGAIDPPALDLPGSYPDGVESTGVG